MPNKCFIAEQRKRGNSVPCGHCPEVPQCPFLTSVCLALQQHLLQLTWSSKPGLGIWLFPPRPGRNRAFSFLRKEGTNLNLIVSHSYQISDRPQTGQGERTGWCRGIMRWLQMRRVHQQAWLPSKTKIKNIFSAVWMAIPNSLLIRNTTSISVSVDIGMSTGVG